MNKRPLGAVGFGLAGGTINLVGSLTALPVMLPLRGIDVWAISLGLASGIALLAGSAALLAFPRHALAIGLTMVTFALLGLFGYFGAVCLGPSFGVFGGFLAITRPTPENPSGSGGAFALAMVSAFFVQLGVVFGTLAPYPFRASPAIEIALGLFAMALLLVGGTLLYLRPWENVVWGSLVIVSAALSLFGAYRGFALGCLFGILAGTIGMVRADEAMRRWWSWRQKM